MVVTRLKEFENMGLMKVGEGERRGLTHLERMC